MILSLLFILLGGLGLYLGGDWIIKGAVSIALRMNLSTYVIGLTVVAFGTSLPELVVSILASSRGEAPLSLGNVLGSNIANVGLILGLAALLKAVPVKRRLLKFDLPYLMLITIGFFVACLDGRLSKVEGACLLAAFAFFVIFSFSRKNVEVEEGEMALLKYVWQDVFFTLAGLVLLAGGAELFTRGAVSIAEFFGVSSFIIGLTVVALGTSLPELVTSLIAAKKGHLDLAFGNVVGSNIFNITLIMGVVGSFWPFDTPYGTREIDLPVVLFFSLLLLVPALRGGFITRRMGVAFLLLYAGYMGIIAYRGM